MGNLVFKIIVSFPPFILKLLYTLKPCHMAVSGSQYGLLSRCGPETTQNSPHAKMVSSSSSFWWALRVALLPYIVEEILQSQPTRHGS